MPKVLLAWIGHADLKASAAESTSGEGPIAQAVRSRSFDHAVLLSDHPKKDADAYVTWLAALAPGCEIVLRPASLKSPTDYEDIYVRVRDNVGWARKQYGAQAKFSFHLSPGTPPMTVIWILVGTTERAELIQSSKERGVETVKVPFQIAAEFMGELAQRGATDLDRLAAGLRPDDPSFADLLHRSAVMKQVIERARLAAVHTAPVLIEGESGTGKELLAAAIHKASGRKGEFIAVNCGAIPKELVESEFFGHKRGAFTGATEERQGHFVQAKGGTLFLDEVGELPADVQVKLLRAIQEKKIVRVGESKQITVDVRIVSATNRNLAAEVAQSNFREDLYYRLAVLSLKMPRLREREGDILLLAEHFLEKLQEKLEKTSARKKLSPGAKNVLLRHSWPGNVRELEATLLRAIVWSKSATISEEDMAGAMATETTRAAAVLDHPLGSGFDLRALLREVSTHYVRRALEASPRNKTEAAKSIGFGSHQLLSQWMKRLGIGGTH